MRPHVARMEQAAMDLLLNKQEWRSRSTARRTPSWLLSWGTRDSDGDQFAFSGTRGAATAVMSDQWDELPLSFSASGFAIRDAWPPPQARPSSVAQPLQVIPTPDGVVVIEDTADSDAGVDPPPQG